MKLYEISNELVSLFDKVDPETGELPPEIDAITADFKSKGASVAAHVLNTQAQIEMRKEVIKKLESANRTAEKKVKNLKEYLMHQMNRTGITEILANDATFKVSLHKERDTSVEIYDERLLEPRCLKLVPERYEPDKTAIRNLLKAGVEIQGARFVKKDRLEIKN